jgi:predicted patatin/cPLA2 family phospholipase
MPEKKKKKKIQNSKTSTVTNAGKDMEKLSNLYIIGRNEKPKLYCFLGKWFGHL